MAAMQSPEHPLEVLPAMLNLVLLQTAKILRDPECHNPKQAGLTKRRITEIVTVANQRFHDALDEVEVEILHAKAVMERDLRVIQQKRAERDLAHAKSTDASLLRETDETVPETSQAPMDAIMVDTVVQPEEQYLNVEQPPGPAVEDLKDAEPPETQDASQGAIVQQQHMPQDAEKPLGLAITMPLDENVKAENQNQSPEKTPDVAQVSEAPVEMPDAIDLDFESMFNDTDPKAMDDTLNFDFDLSTDAPMAHNILNDSTFNDISVNDSNTMNVPASTNEFESLLPGVENYLNVDTDLSSLSMPPVSSIPESSTAPVASTFEHSAQVSTEPIVGETSFDDNFFAFSDFDMGENRGDELGESALADLDDFKWD